MTDPHRLLMENVVQLFPDQLTHSLAREELEAFTHRFFAQVDFDDIGERTPADLAALVFQHLAIAQNRVGSNAIVDVANPSLVAESNAKWTSPNTVITIVVPDCPFLVDSVAIVLARRAIGTHLFIHPVERVSRDAKGQLTGFASKRAKDGEPESGFVTEAWMHVEVERQHDSTVLDALRIEILTALADVAAINEDDATMHELARGFALSIPKQSLPVSAEDIAEAVELLTWLATDSFQFLGYREYRVQDEVGMPGEHVLRAVPLTGLGLLRENLRPPKGNRLSAMSPDRRRRFEDPDLLIVTKDGSRSPIVRDEYFEYIGVKIYGRNGEVVGEHRFLGLFAASVFRRSIFDIPFLRSRAEQVISQTGLSITSYMGRELVDTLEAFPRDELFEISVPELLRIATGITKLQERKQVRVFGRRDDFGRFLSVLVYVPRDRFSNTIAERIVDVLKEMCGGDSTEHYARVTERINARVHVLIHLRDDAPKWVDDDLVEQRITELTRWWIDDVRDHAHAVFGNGMAAQVVARAAAAFPPSYRDAYGAVTTLADLARIEELGPERTLINALVHHHDDPEDLWHFNIYALGNALALSSVLPYLENLGVEVIDERPYEIDTSSIHSGLPLETITVESTDVPGGSAKSTERNTAERPATTMATTVWLHDIGIRIRNGASLDSDAIRTEFQNGFTSLWRGEVENDGLNQLIVRAGLSAHQIVILRAYAQYLRQIGIPFTPAYVEATLLVHTPITKQLTGLFEAMFHPELHRTESEQEKLRDTITQSLDAVSSLDEDRILRSFLSVINATTRTNTYRSLIAPEAPCSSALSFKFDPTRIVDLPAPRPKYEIWVYSPLVEGVHLRGGDIARGGLRWSDRREDFRTEVLGLMKAQMVKNAVIVPVGAKGGFYPKQLPTDPAARRAQVVSCYDTYVSALLDITDNIVVSGDPASTQIVGPVGVRRLDGDDPYLVVAADKGTATFSDIANGVSARYGFWLGDAFASGGSVGYDHKAMGITARGAWESVRRHLRTIGRDPETAEITTVGVGDMSGDVFGNGMLLSSHIKLLAAFDHRHIFLDPNPDPAASFAERKRLFVLPSSSWDDYEKALISTGGGVWSRSAKSVPISPEIREALGLPASVSALTPTALMSTILRAPVDLLWNGGIGTYVKASTEQHGDAGDRANDALRVNGNELRCAIVGEGGNLGFTQRGRVEFALTGGLINTDALDNSAGVDCSDHEVNIKIALGAAVATGEISMEKRNEILATMTDDVGELVLDDNRAQNLALAIARKQAVVMADVHARQIRAMELAGQVNRQLEFLPDEKQLAERHASGRGLTTPEFAVLLAYTKEITASAVLASDLPDDPYVHGSLRHYFPQLLQDRFASAIDNHRLRREIIATSIVNEMVNRAGLSFEHRMIEETSATVADITRANIAARDIFGLREQWDEVDDQAMRVEPDHQLELFLALRRLTERGTLWLLRHRRSPIDLSVTVSGLQPGVNALMGAFPEILVGSFGEAVQEQIRVHEAAGVPTALARRAAGWPYSHTAPDIVELSHIHIRPPIETAKLYWQIFDRLDLTWLWEQIGRLPRTDRWRTQARAALRDDLLFELRALTNDVLQSTLTFDAWFATNGAAVDRTLQLFADIRAQGVFDLSTLTVALRQVRNLAMATATPK